MTLQNLSKILDKYEQQLGSTNVQQFELLKGLPFYDWNNLLVNKCLTFNHAIGLPQRNGQSFQLFDYEQLIFDTLQKHKHLWIKKATGLGVTEFMLRYMAWLCFSHDLDIATAKSISQNSNDLVLNRAKLKGSQMCRISNHPYR